MNTERFRFRAWDSGVNRMFYGPNGITLDELSTLAKECALESSEPDYQDQWYVDNPKCIWMQSTGLRDSEGRLIWEGDVVLIPDEYTVPILDYGQGPREPCPHIVAIEYRDGEFGFDIPKTDDGETGWYSWRRWNTEIDDAFKIKVLGNIYEHGHLLTQHKSAGKEGEG